MEIDIISMVERSQTDEVTERKVVGPEQEELVGLNVKPHRGRLKSKEPNSAKKKGVRDEHHIYESLPRNADK